MYKKNVTVKCCKKSVSKDWYRADIPVASIIAILGQTGSNLQPLSRDLGYIRTILGNALYDPCPRMGDLSQGISRLQLSRHGRADPEEGNPKNGRIEQGIGLYIAKSGNDTRVIKSRNVYAIDKAGARR